MNSLQKAINLLNELKALLDYCQGLDPADYGIPKHAIYLQKNVSRILVYLFHERFPEADRAAANMQLLIMYKQIGEMKLAPERLSEIMNVYIPVQMDILEMKIEEMLNSGDEEVDPVPLPRANPINN